MSKILHKIIVSCVCLLLVASVKAQVNVTGGTAATYTTLSDAFAAINAGTHTGAIAITITGNTTEPTAPVALLKSGGTSSYTAITIMPSGGDWTINSAATPTANRGIIELQGADNVTIDGDDPLTVGARNLTIQSATSTAAIACIRLSSNSTTGLDGADNNTVKNCIIIGARASAISTTTNYGINMSNYSTTSLTTGAYSSLNTVIENNDIRRCYRAIYANGVSATYLNTGLVVRNNVFGSTTSAADNIGLTCLFMAYTSSTAGATSALVEGNTFRTGDISISGVGYGASVNGMEIGTVNAGAKVRNNTFVVYQPSTAGWGAFGILVSGSTSCNDIEIYNNMITAAAIKYSATVSNQFTAFGIRYSAGATLQKINYNTIYIPLFQNGTVPNYNSIGIGAMVAGVTIAEMKNNLIVNENIGTSTFCVYLNTAGNLLTGAANYNNYYAANGNVGYLTSAQTTLAAWQTATSQDANSLSTLAVFKAANDLHIDTTNSSNVIIMNAGTPLAGVTTDFDGQTRPSTPSIGADQFTIPACTGADAGVMSISTTPICVGSSSTLSISGITSTDGAGTSYQWFDSPDGLTWSAIAGAVSKSYTYANATTAKYFMFVNACANTMTADSVSGQVTILAPTYATLPFYENFEASWSNVCATKDVPNNSWRNLPAMGNNSWRRQDEGSTASWANPTTNIVNPASNTLYGGGTGAANFHTYYSPANVTGSLLAYINMATTDPLTLSFDHFNTSGTDTLKVYLSFNGGNTFNKVGEFDVATSWTRRTVNLGVVNRANAVLKFEVTNLSTFGNDVGIDNVLVSPPCTTPPTAGTLNGPNDVCLNASGSFNITGYTTGPGSTVLWETSLDGVTFTSNAADTLAVLNTTITDTTWVRAIVGCSGMYDTTTVKYVTLSSFLKCYCASAAAGTTEDDIGQVSIAGISNPAVRPTPQSSNPNANKTYTNYSDSIAPINLLKTINYPATIYHIHSTTDQTTNYCNIYIDYNKNGVFDSWETYTLSKASGNFYNDFTGLVTIPDTAGLGLTGMRVVLREGAITGPCGSQGSWAEVEDYLVNLLPAPACTNPPVAGFISGDSSICSGGTLSFSLDSASVGSTYQWQSSTDGTTWTDISGATTTLYTTPAILDTVYYRVKQWCVDTSYSPVKTITLKPSYYCYCSSYATSTGDTKIDSFYFAGIVTGSLSGTCETYTNYTSGTVGSVQKTVPTSVLVKNGSCSGFHYGAYARVFVDINQSGTYDAGEELYTSAISTALGSLTPGSITIPSSALTGLTGMRVVLRESTVPSACGTYSYGETEDYLINILPSPPCVDTPVAGTISGNQNVLANTTELYIVSTTTGTNYQWQFALDTNGTWTNIAGATDDSLSVTLNVADTAYLRVIVSSVGCIDDTSAAYPIVITLPGNDVCNAVPLSFGVNGPFITTAATAQAGEPAPAGGGCGTQNGWCNNSITNTLWFSFTAPASGRVIIQSPDFDTQLALWDAANCDTILHGGATLLAANDDDGFSTSHGGVAYSSYIDTVKCLTPGKTYYVQLDPYSSPGDTTRIILTDPGAPNTAFTLDTQYCSSNVAISLNPVQAGGTFTGTGVTGTTFTPSTPGTYTITYSFGGCDTLSKTTTVIASPTVNLGADTAVCTPNTVVFDAGNAGATYLWNDATTNQTVTASATGNYSVEVTAANGCKANDTVALTVNSLPVVNLGNDTAVCTPNTVVFNAGNAGATYLWNDASVAQTLTATATGNYSVVVTDANGCKGTDTVALTVNSLPIVNLGNDTAVCTPNTVVFNAGNAGATYLWNDATTNQTLTASATGDYSVVVTDANGCVSTDSVKLQVNLLPSVSLGSDATICAGDSITFDAANAGATYLWNDATTAQTLTATAAGSYSVVVTDANGCKGTDTVALTVNSLPVVNLGADVTQCGGAATLDAGNAGAIYAWSNAATTQTTIVSSTGNYSVVVTDANGCLGRDTVVVTINALPIVNLGADKGICSGSSATLDAGNAGSSYAWSNAATTQTTAVSAAGSYNVVVTDANGCKGSDTINITVNSLPVVNLGADTARCGGSITLNAGNAGATYAWSNAAITQTTAASSTGNYSVVVTDANGCKGTDTIHVTINALPTVTFSFATDSICNNAAVVTLSGTPASGIFSGAGVTGGSFNAATAGLGTHTVTYSYTDANGCTGTASDMIVVKNCTGINDMNKLTATIYPTPTTGIVNIRGVETTKETITVKVYDMQGKLVSSQTVGGINNVYQIDVTTVASGVYNIQIATETGNYTGRIVRE